MVKSEFSNVSTWVFDLDHTLYPPSANLFGQIEVRMTDYVQRSLGVDKETADTLRQSYWAKYGTTLTGLMREHNIDPTPYLTDVHDIDFSVLSADPELAVRITNLPGRKIVYTNGTASYAHRVLEARKLEHVFDEIYGVEDAELLPKPERPAFEIVFKKDGLVPTQAAMFEDDPRNLSVPFDMGLKTVLVGPNQPDHRFIQHYTNDLAGFLSQLV